jgi:cell division protein FtsB
LQGHYEIDSTNEFLTARQHGVAMAIKSIRFDYLVSAGCLLLLAYFAWHAWHGPRSYSYINTLTTKQAALLAEKSQLEQRKQAMLQKVNLMRPESVDHDMLEELARESLGWVTSNELIIKTAN